ncbi:MAG: Gfo/Idh/MocA family oxidoreductase [Gammaproteobacteria bacterium]|nr:Gfo/Idh/MocA family oxidoreductase [Gammaproteobacteria bacterium]
MKKFALIGAAGYVAPRHMKAIKDTGNCLMAALDKHDSVGVLDSYFPDADFFTEFERFDRHIDKRRRSDPEKHIDYVSICSPNYLHDSHVRFALRSDADAICEKPLVLNPWNIDGLLGIEKDTGRDAYTILQLRLHPSILALRKKVLSEKQSTKHDVDLTYVTSRGRWYLQSWKGDQSKSGGIATNIGVHFYDMLQFVFGSIQDNKVHFSSDTKASGFLEYEHARVRWFLSIDIDDVPSKSQEKGQRTFRSVTCDREEIEFSGGFTDLHTRSYEEILAGRGFGLEENRVAIETVAAIRQATPLGLTGDYHPFLKGLSK